VRKGLGIRGGVGWGQAGVWKGWRMGERRGSGEGGEKEESERGKISRRRESRRTIDI